MHFHWLLVFSIVLFGSCVGLSTMRQGSDIGINEIFEDGSFDIGETSYEYPIVYDAELTPTSTNLTTQIRGQVYFPNPTVSNARSSFPILIFLPGKHADCRIPITPGYPALDINSTDIWGHCPNNLLKVPSHLGFAYLGRYFGSHGYIVVSIDIISINNKWSIPGDDTLNFVRARIVLKTLEKMKEWNSNTDNSKQALGGVDLSGSFDFTQIGMMGHSRGGEGVRNAYSMLMENKGPSDTPMWRERLSGMTIRAIIEIAPMYYGQNGIKFGVDNIPWAMIVAGCEDDEIDYVHVNLAYQQFKTAKQPNYILHVYGANHEYFNTEWQVGIPMCLGDQEPLWDVNATTFKVSDLYPPARNTSLDLTLLKINGSESQRNTTIFALSSFFRAYVGANANPAFASLLEPSTPLPAILTEIGRQYFNHGHDRSIVLFDGSNGVFGTSGARIIPLQEYAQSTFNEFATAYDNSRIPPPHFMFNPPQKGNLTLDCLDQIENAIHIDFGNSTKEEILIIFNETLTENLKTIDIQLARRSSCWFTSTNPLTCAEPKEMKIQIQLQTSSGFLTSANLLLKSRFNLQFARCNAMDMPPEKIGFLPVMFETIRLSITDSKQVRAIKFIGQNGGSMILGNIMASAQLPSTSSSLSISPIYIASSFLLLLFSIFHLI